MTTFYRVDPEGCRCTDCITGTFSIPLDWLPKEVYLFLDDEREVSWVMQYESPENLAKWITVRTAEQALAVIRTGKVVEISFDNDLGHKSTMEGWEVMREMVSLILDGKIPRPRYIGIHTANVVAAQRMQGYLQDLTRFFPERRAAT